MASTTPATEHSPLLNIDSAASSSINITSHAVYRSTTKSPPSSSHPPPLSLGLIIASSLSDSSSNTNTSSSMSAAVNPAVAATGSGGARVADLLPGGLVSPRRNPFHYTSPVDRYETIKIIVMCLLGIPLLRILLLLATSMILVILCSIATIGFVAIDPVTKQQRPLPKWRQLLCSPRPFLLRVVLFALGYHWIQVTLPKGGLSRKKGNAPRIVVSNHVGFIDGPFLSYYLNVSIAMKAELSRIPIIGAVIKTLQPILIDRNTSEGRKRAVHAIADHIAHEDYPPLLLFPEGTTSNQNYLTKFKVGSFSSGLACQPVTLKYPFQHFDVSWTPDISALHLLLRMLCQVHNRLEVEFLPPYFPSDDEKTNPELYAENVRQLMATGLNVTCTNHAFEDVALLMACGNYQYADQHVVPITDVGEVSSLTALRSGDIQRLVQHFIKKDLNGDGQLSLDEMASLFPNDNTELLERLFVLLDTDDSGSIDFRELCIGLAALNPNRDTTTLMEFAFRLYDTDNNGYLDTDELNRMLAFFHSFYGSAATTTTTTTATTADQDTDVPVDLESELQRDAQGHVTFDSFRDFMTRHPMFLGHVKSKLQVLRGGSFRGRSTKFTTATERLGAIMPLK